MSVPRRHQRSSGGLSQLAIALLLTLAVMLVELVVGWLSHSLALVADAGHMLTDASTLALSLFAAWFAERPPTMRKTFGYHRTEILAALANGLALWLIVIWIYVRAIHRLRHPVDVAPGPMIAVAAVGLCVNLFSGWLLQRQRLHNLNVQSAWLNVMSDALGSIGVIGAGCLIHWFGWRAADPLASMAIGVLITVSSWHLISQSINILLEGTPGHLRISDVAYAMRQLPGVRDVHDLHLWTITTGMDAMSGHVIVDDVSRSAHLLTQLNALLADRFGITHTTFQLEPRQHACGMHGPSA